MKNPSWVIDELILALDLYISGGRKVPGDNDVMVYNLSELLNKFWKNETQKTVTLRNPNGIRMKIMNFLRFDPNYTNTGRVGLSRGNKLEEVVWQQYADNPVLLAAMAQSIRDNINANIKLDFNDMSMDIDSEGVEGRILSRKHYVRERNKRLIQKKKNYYLKQYGKLECEACGFNFYKVYGERGSGFIECHHTNPLSEINQVTKTKLEDLVLLCSNCHRMIHAKRPWLSINDLISIINPKS